MEQALRPVSWPASSPLMSLNDGAGVLSSALQLLRTEPSEQGCRVHLPSPEPEERRAVEARGAGSMLQAVMHLAPGD